MHEAVWTHLRDLEAAQYSRGTIANRDQVMRRYEAAVGDVLTCGTEAAGRWYLGLGPLAPNSLCNYLAHVRSFYRWCARQELRADDPTRRITGPRYRRGLPRPVPLPAAQALYAGSTGGDRIAIGLMFGCGLRCAEVAAARREDWDGERLWVHGKGDKLRAVPVPPTLARLIEAQGAGPLLSGPHGSLTAEAVSGRYARLLRRAGILATAHQLRHTYGTEAHRRLKDLRAVAELMGHASITTTAGYAAVELSGVGALLADLISRDD